MYKRQGLDFRIGNMSWAPYLPVTVYKYLTSENKQVTFKHNFDDELKNKYRKLKTSPYANDEVNRLVNACLSNTSSGKDAVPDFLSLAYYAGNYDHKAPAELPMEMQDTYVPVSYTHLDVYKRQGKEPTAFYHCTNALEKYSKIYIFHI